MGAGLTENGHEGTTLGVGGDVLKVYCGGGGTFIYILYKSPTVILATGEFYGAQIIP